MSGMSRELDNEGKSQKGKFNYFATWVVEQ